MRTEAERAAFIRANTRVLPVPLVPELALHVADEATDLWQATERALDTIGLPPPFWAFAWAGGQALARFILDAPEQVRGCRVLDLASGSGLVALAAARAGAATVQANDIDPLALTAIALNAAHNQVVVDPDLGDRIGSADSWDVVLAGDIFYERDTAARVIAWLAALAQHGTRVLIGDPGRAYLDRALLEQMAEFDVPVSRALEDADIKRSGVWRFRSAEAISPSS